MKKLLAGIACAALVLAFNTPSALAKEKAKDQVIKGEAKCAMCMLHEGSECKTVIQTTRKNGKTVTYYLVDNDISKGFHENVCHAGKKVVAKGSVKEVDGKKMLTLTKIDLAKK